MLGGISKKLAYHLLQNNIIKSIKIGRQYKIAKAWVSTVIKVARGNKRQAIQKAEEYREHFQILKSVASFEFTL